MRATRALVDVRYTARPLTLDPAQEFMIHAVVTWRAAVESIGIGVLAKRAGVGIDTVRYYERAGLLAPSSRLASGYRRYSELEVARLRFIRRAQTLGFTLKEVGELLALSARPDVARVKKAAQAKLADVEKRIAALERIRAGLARLIAACPGHGRAADCPILQALAATSP